MSVWVQVDIEHLLYVDRGRDTILCDRHNFPTGATLMLRVSEAALGDLAREIAEAKPCSAREEVRAG